MPHAFRTGLRLLASGRVCIKRAEGTGGLGQQVAADADALDRALASLAPDALARHGCVVEQHPDDVTTSSVGQVVVVADSMLSYCGTQRLTGNHHGEQVYGGSDRVLVRGDFAALLLELDLPAEMRQAIGQARANSMPRFTCIRVSLHSGAITTWRRAMTRIAAGSPGCWNSRGASAVRVRPKCLRWRLFCRMRSRAWCC